jgi:hypothetical protein
VTDVAASKMAFFRARLEQNIKSFRRRRKLNRILAFVLRMSVILLGSLTTILLGLKGYHPFNVQEDLLTGCALISSAVVTVLSAWEIFFDHRWLWILYTRTLLELNEVADNLAYRSAGNTDMPEEELDILYDRFHRIIEGTNMAWTEKRRRERMPGDAGVVHEPSHPPSLGIWSPGKDA